MKTTSLLAAILIFAGGSSVYGSPTGDAPPKKAKPDFTTPAWVLYDMGGISGNFYRFYRKQGETRVTAVTLRRGKLRAVRWEEGGRIHFVNTNGTTGSMPIPRQKAVPPAGKGKAGTPAKVFDLEAFYRDNRNKIDRMTPFVWEDADYRVEGKFKPRPVGRRHVFDMQVTIYKNKEKVATLNDNALNGFGRLVDYGRQPGFDTIGDVDAWWHDKDSLEVRYKGLMRLVTNVHEAGASDLDRIAMIETYDAVYQRFLDSLPK